LTKSNGYVRLRQIEPSVDYTYGPFSSPMEGAAPGRAVRFELRDSRVYPGARLSVWLHLPHGADAASAMNYCVFQDGWLYLDPDRPVRAGRALDNLYSRGLIPPTVGIFVNPGTVAPKVAGNVNQRNVEYDPFTPDYGTFVRDEVFPLVEQHVALTRESKGNFISGGSSGGDCSFTAA